jgi:hypothetical protein
MEMAETERRITFQPDPNRTLRDPGVIDFRINLDSRRLAARAQLAGIVIMMTVLFEPNITHHIEIHRPMAQELTYLDPFVRGHIVKIGPEMWPIFNSLVNSESRWSQVIAGLPGRHGSINESSYSAMLWNYPRTTRYIFNFQSLEFLQGAITACRWLGLNPREYITHLHAGNTAMEVVNL